MPICRVKPSADLVSQELLNEIKAIRPLRLFINKQKKKGIVDKPFNLRVKFCKLSQEKQAKFLQKSVDQYIDLLDERDVDESVQIQCRLFDYLLAKKEQKRYFQSINAPIKPPGKVAPSLNQNSFDNDSDVSWKSSTVDEQKAHRYRRKEAISAYEAQARNFANDLPDRLRTDYLLCLDLISDKSSSSPINSPNGSIRQRRKSLTALPESLQTEPIVNTHQTKLTRSQLDELHRFLPHELYYEKEFNDSHKRKFQTRTSKNRHTRTLFNRLASEQRLKYILKSIDKWNEFLKSNPWIIDNQIPTLHLLLPKNEEIRLYFSSLGFPQRPPLNSYLLYQLEPSSSDQTWSDLTEQERQTYIQELKQLKTVYYKELIDFVDDQLPNDYLRYEFFRNIKYALRDYELALKTHTNESCSSLIKYHEKKIMFNCDRRQFQQIKRKLLATQLTNEQKNLVEELSDLLSKYIE